MTVRERAWNGVMIFPSIIGIILYPIVVAVLLVVVVIAAFVGLFVAILCLLCGECGCWRDVWKFIAKTTVIMFNCFGQIVIALIMLPIGFPLGIVLLLISCCVPDEQEEVPPIEV